MKGETMSNELASLKNHFQQVAAETQGGALGTLLKFKKGRYYINEVEVTGETRIAHVEATMRGYVKFQDGKRVAQRIGRVADGFQLPRRDDLGDLDQEEWQRDSSGKLVDPWSQQYYLPMEDPEDGAIAIFVTGSVGGIGAVGKLCDVFSNNLGKGLPVIKLDVRSYPHPDWGRIETPDFKVLSWDGGEVVIPPSSPPASPQPAAAVKKDDMNDEIPF
jgi:hypothetical protein